MSPLAYRALGAVFLAVAVLLVMGFDGRAIAVSGLIGLAFDCVYRAATVQRVEGHCEDKRPPAARLLFEYHHDDTGSVVACQHGYLNWAKCPYGCKEGERIQHEHSC